MFDLYAASADQHGSPNTRIDAANRPARDRAGWRADLAGVVFFSLVACAPLPPPQPRRLPPVWVDAFAPEGGDGSEAAPFKAVPSPVPVAALHLRSGVYEGPFEIPTGATVEGHGEVVLTATGEEPVVSLTGAALKQVSSQGGGVGLKSKDAMLDGVRFSGQRKVAIQAEGGLRGRKLHFTSTVEGIDGLVGADARVSLHETKFEGGFRRAIDVSGGELRLSGLSFNGAKTAVRALDADSRVQAADATGGSATAFFFAGGRLKVSQLDVQGYEFSIQLARGVLAELEELSASGAAAGCLSLLDADVKLTRARLSRCGPTGAVSLNKGKLTASELVVRESRELGVVVRLGEASFTQLDVGGTRDGDALHVRDAEVTVHGANLRDSGGSGLFVSAQARVIGDEVLVERAKKSAFFVERGATVELGRVKVRGGSGPAVLVPDAATVRLKSLDVTGGDEPPVYAECNSGALVKIESLTSTIPPVPSPCVTR